VLAHLEHALAYRLYVAQIAVLRLFQATRQPPMRQAILEAIKPSGELRQLANRVHGLIVIERLHVVNRPRAAIGMSSSTGMGSAGKPAR